MIEEFNKNMKEVFSSGWINCLDESMSIWTNRWTCPGWVFCPRKPHPYGNEYHTICCGLCGILFRLIMVEGKDRPPELSKPPKNKATVDLLLCMCSTIASTGKVVVLDSGFCVLKGIIELKKIGVYAGALIKKRRFWPKFVPGEAIDQHFKDKEVGETDSLYGELEGVHYDIFGMKEPDYIMKIMSTYGGLNVNDGQRESMRKYFKDGTEVEKRFQYAIPFSNHFDYRHIVDDHNNLRHSMPSIEAIWTTHRWPTRVFSFILAVTEVNCYLAFKYFIWSGVEKMTLMEFRTKLAWALIENEYLDKAEATEVKNKRKKAGVDHVLRTAPKRAKNWDGQKWDLSAKMDYPQFWCRMKGCRKSIRTYCQCNVGSWLCKDCFPEHIMEQVR